MTRFWSKVDKSGDCWTWQGTKNTKGYGRLTVSGQMVMAHRYAYESAYGAIPGGLQLDHLCRVRHCVNPGHLEPVTIAENLRRGNGLAAVNAAKKKCKRGHAFTADNTWTYRGMRRCRECSRQRCREWRRNHKGDK